MFQPKFARVSESEKNTPVNYDMTPAVTRKLSRIASMFLDAPRRSTYDNFLKYSQTNPHDTSAITRAITILGFSGDLNGLFEVITMDYPCYPWDGTVRSAIYDANTPRGQAMLTELDYWQRVYKPMMPTELGGQSLPFCPPTNDLRDYQDAIAAARASNG